MEGAHELEKELTETDVRHKLVVPVQWLDEMPPFEGGCREVQFGVLDDKGFHFPLCCSIRNGGYRKPVLQAEGWLRFVNYKGLKIGDKIIFRPQIDHFRETKFQVRAQRQNIHGHWVDI
ncbi:PREDICTED: B3 domain-containing [Prunus dulcis]|uniref:PREDICTED: B3 domain-containing n=1 Tax=Prunus dulcis TaxID=3755 RepID=A0A5E4FX98_PRUDU|nr:hypothetical protein L3X38_009195 [Prunus dulcis]VVA32069.1 PREDICTED: B3 domain-containing [Prunus dulcis]VVA40733.1 PREDICTED: B3 domain-containing [Prunus dulcis]